MNPSSKIFSQSMICSWKMVLHHVYIGEETVSVITTDWRLFGIAFKILEHL